MPSAPFQHRAASVGVTEPIIRRVIDDFYGRVRRDPLLGPIFEEAIGDDWDPHLEKIRQFWLSATRLGDKYESAGFMPAHLKLQNVGREHMDRWLALFRETANEHCSPEAADALIDIAVRMGESILYGIKRADGEKRQQTS
jgi:hemoglobin